MGAHGIGHIPGGVSLSTRLALLEMEAEQAMYRADCTLRDAAREAKRHHNERQVEEMRNKASALMTQAFTSGALQIAAGATQFASASQRLEAGQAKLEADGLAHASSSAQPDAGGHGTLLEEQQLRTKALFTEATAQKLCTIATVLNGSAETVNALMSSVAARCDADAAKERHAAENAGWRADDAQESARRRQAQLDQKLAILQQMLSDDADTRRALLRG